MRTRNDIGAGRWRRTSRWPAPISIARGSANARSRPRCSRSRAASRWCSGAIPPRSWRWRPILPPCRRRCRTGCRPSCSSGVPISSPPNAAWRRRFTAVQVAKAARLPRFALTGGGGRSSSELIRLVGVGAGFWRAGIELLAPIFIGGALQAQVRLATAEQEAALALFGQAALRAFSEVESSLAQRAAARRPAALSRSRAGAGHAKRCASAACAIDGGATDLLHVLEIQTRLLNTQFDLIGIRNDRLANRIALHLALGGGFAAPTP